jgi:hypothetical protein
MPIPSSAKPSLHQQLLAVKAKHTATNKVKPNLPELLGQINDQIKSIETQFKSMYPMDFTTIPITLRSPNEAENSEINEYLEFAKINGMWRIWYFVESKSSNTTISIPTASDEFKDTPEDQAPPHFRTVDRKPLTDCPAFVRIRAAKLLPQLHDAIVASNTKLIAEAEEAIKTLTALKEKLG